MSKQVLSLEPAINYTLTIRATEAIHFQLYTGVMITTVDFLAG